MPAGGHRLLRPRVELPDRRRRARVHLQRPPGHVADTKRNRPYVRRDAVAAVQPHRRPRRSRGGAGRRWLVIDRDRFDTPSRRCRSPTATGATSSTGSRDERRLGRRRPSAPARRRAARGRHRLVGVLPLARLPRRRPRTRSGARSAAPSVGLVLLAAVVIQGVYVAQGARWRLIADTLELTVRRFYALVLGGIGANNVLPLRIGDLLRARWLATSAEIPTGRAFGSVFRDRACDVLTLVVALAVVAADRRRCRLGGADRGRRRRPAGGARARRRRRGRLRAHAAAGPAREPQPGPAAAPRHDRRGRLADRPAPTRPRARAERRRLGRLGVSRPGSSAGRSASPLSPVELVFVTAVINLGVVIPSSPGFIGTYQWLAVSALGVVGVDGDVAIAFSLLMQAIWYIPTTIVGGVIAIREVHREATRVAGERRAASTIARVKVLLVSFYFPPAGGGGVQRPLKLAQYLPALGIETHVLAPDDPQWIHRDEALRVPTQAWVHRARYLGPSGRKPAEELHGKAGSRPADDPGAAVRPPRARARRERAVEPHRDPRRDPARAQARDRRRDHDVAAELDPPRRRRGEAGDRAPAGWRTCATRPIAHVHRRSESAAVRAKEKVDVGVAKLVARSADAIVCVADFIADEVRALEPRGQRRHDPERLRLRRLRGARLLPGRAPPDHAHGQLLRQARSAAVPAGAPRLRARRRRHASSATSAAPIASGPSSSTSATGSS